jgi:hypothetical protein
MTLLGSIESSFEGNIIKVHQYNLERWRIRK